MSTLNISLPEVMKHFVEEQVREGMYASASDYIRALVREDQKRRAQDELEAKLLEALESGDATEMTQEDWAQIRRDALTRLQQRHTDPAA
jgi:antitoxin ParD1/3/4